MPTPIPTFDMEGVGIKSYHAKKVLNCCNKQDIHINTQHTQTKNIAKNVPPTHTHTYIRNEYITRIYE